MNLRKLLLIGKTYGLIIFAYLTKQPLTYKLNVYKSCGDKSM